MTPAFRYLCQFVVAFPVLIVLSVAPSLADRLASFEEKGLALTLSEEALSEFVLSVSSEGIISGLSPKVSLLRDPFRLVLDVPYRDDAQTAVRQVPLTHSKVSALRLGNLENVLRIVIEIENDTAPEYSLSPGDPAHAVRLSFSLPPPLPEAFTGASPQGESVVKGQNADDSGAPAANEKRSVDAYTVKGNQIRVVEINKKMTLSKTAPESSGSSAITAPRHQPGSTTRLLSENLHDELEQRKRELQNLRDGKFNYEQPSSAIVSELQPKRQLAQPLTARVIPSNANTRREANQYFAVALAVVVILVGLALVVFQFKRELSGGSAEDWQAAPIDTRSLAEEERARRELVRKEKRIAECCAVLGVKDSDSPDEIRGRYKHLVKVFHEDKLTSQDLPEEMIALANERFKSIQHAYETLKREKNFS